MKRVEINEELSEMYHHLPSTELIDKIKSRAEKMGYYSSTEFSQLMTIWRTEAGAIENKDIKEDQIIFLNTVESIRRFATVSKQEFKRPVDRWQTNSKLAAADMAKHVMFTADRLKNNQSLLNKFWQDIYRPLALSGGYNQSELDRLTSGFMAELAVGEALDHVFTITRRSDLEVFKGEPLEDVEQGKDLVVVSKKDHSEFPLQIKLQRGYGDSFVDWQQGNNGVQGVNLYYKQGVNELFDLYTGQPKSELIIKLGSTMPRVFRKAA